MMPTERTVPSPDTSEAVMPVSHLARAEDLIPLLRVVPQYSLPPVEKLEDVLGIYPGCLITFVKKHSADIPEAAGELGGEAELLRVRSVRGKQRFDFENLDKVEISKFGTRRKWMNLGRIHGKELRITAKDGRRAALFFPGFEGEHPARVLRHLLGDRCVEECVFKPKMSTVFFSKIGIVAGYLFWTFFLMLPIAFAAAALGSYAKNHEGLFALAVMAALFGSLLFSMFAGGWILGWLEAWVVPRIKRYHDSAPPELNPKRVIPKVKSREPFRSDALSLLCKLVGVFLVVTAGSIALHMARAQTGEYAQIWQLAGRIFGVVGILPGAALIYIGYRLGLRSAARTLLSDSRPAILYLRSFDDDGKNDLNPDGAWSFLLGVRPSPALKFLGPLANLYPLRLLRLTLSRTADTAEEQLGAYFRKKGPFIAIGRPGDQFAPGGADRDYLKEGEDWRLRVRALLGRSQTVVLQPAETEGVWWEIVETIRSIPPRGVLFCLINYAQSQHRYELFRSHFRAATGVEIPRFLGSNIFLWFDDAWRGHLLPLRTSNPLVWPYVNTAANIERTLRPWSGSGSNKVLPAAPPRGTAATGCSGCLSFAIIFGIAFVISNVYGLVIDLGVNELWERGTLILADRAMRPPQPNIQYSDPHAHFAVSPGGSWRLQKGDGDRLVFLIGATARLECYSGNHDPVSRENYDAELTKDYHYSLFYGDPQDNLTNSFIDSGGVRWRESEYDETLRQAHWIEFFGVGFFPVTAHVIERTCFVDDLFIKQVVYVKKPHFAMASSMLWTTLNRISVAPGVYLTPENSKTYAGKSLPYTLALTKDWQEVPATQGLDRSFVLPHFGTLRAEFVVLAERLTADLKNRRFDTEMYAEGVLNRARGTGGASMRLESRRKVRIGREDWFELRYQYADRTTFMFGEQRYFITAVIVTGDKAFQLTGMSNYAGHDSGAIERAMQGFRFGERP